MRKKNINDTMLKANKHVEDFIQDHLIGLKQKQI
jgi:hypothetical protein